MIEWIGFRFFVQETPRFHAKKTVTSCRISSNPCVESWGEASYAFADIFVTVWVGSGVVTLNAVLLRGKARGEVVFGAFWQVVGWKPPKSNGLRHHFPKIEMGIGSN